MRYTYVLLACVFLSISWLIVQRLQYRASKNILIVTTICYTMMVVFNTYLTSLPIVQYDWQKVLGIKMISWPIEDLAYLVVGLYMSQAVYQYWLQHYEKKQQAQPAQRPTAADKKRNPANS